MRIYYTEAPTKGRQDLGNLRALVPLLWSYRGRTGLALASLIIAKLATVAVPLLLKEIIDGLTIEAGPELLLPLGLLIGYGALRLASSLFTELRDLIFSKVRHGAMRELALRVFKHLHALSLRFHLERKTGGISRDIERGTRSVSALLNYMVFSVIPIVVEFGLVAAILFTQYRPAFAVITLVAVVAYILFTFWVTAWRMQFRQRMNFMDSEANTQAIDSLINYETVKYFGSERYEAERYDASMAEWERAALSAQSSMSVLNLGQAIIIAVAVTLMMVLAGQGVVSGELTVGDLVLVNAFLIQLFLPLGFLGIVYSQLQHGLTDMDRLYRLLEVSPEIEDRTTATQLQIAGGEIRFEQVDFAYQPERPILHGIDFTLRPGRKLAVVGASGSGKSSLVRLLYRFYDVGAGRILIDGQDIRDVTQESLRQAIGIVPQDTVLFNDSLRYNIAYARPGASFDDICSAARLANIHDFIDSLPDGYDTIVGERGLKLSGGEKQRVAIARVFLKDPPILVFDEATSSLDSHAEQQIITAMRDVAVHRSTLVIAHRLSTVVDADEILVMDAGRLIERGTHAQLLELRGHYGAMWALQQESAE